MLSLYIIEKWIYPVFESMLLVPKSQGEDKTNWNLVLMIPDLSYVSKLPSGFLNFSIILWLKA